MLNPLLSLAVTGIDNELNGLQGEGWKKVIPFDNIEDWTRLQNFLELKLSGHTNTLTEASSLIKKFKKGETQADQRYRNALDNFYTI